MSLKLAFANLFDNADVRRGSGTWFYFARELEHQGHTVYRLNLGDVPIPWPTRLLASLYRRTGRRYFSHLDPFVGRRLGILLAHRLGQLDFDVLLTTDYAIASYAPMDRPLVIYTDSILPLKPQERINPHLQGLSGTSIAFFKYLLRRSLGRAALTAFPTQWAAEQARLYQNLPSERLQVIPFGANLDDPGPEFADRRASLGIPSDHRIELLFVGKDWKFKGGAVAAEAVRELNRRGIDSLLNVVGATPPAGTDRSHLRCHGDLDKSHGPDRQLFHELFLRSSALLLPSQAEGFGIAAVEAAAYGLPVIAYDTQGVRESVRHGESGILLPRTMGPEAFANALEALLIHPAHFGALSRGGRRFFETTANWPTAAEQLLRGIERVSHKDLSGKEQI